MNTLDIKEAARAELRRINTSELAFHSSHEAWAVLLEEVIETKVEIQAVDDLVRELMGLVFSDSKKGHKFDVLGEVYTRAINAAAEAVQVAAVASKFANFMMDDEKEV